MQQPFLPMNTAGSPTNNTSGTFSFVDDIRGRFRGALNTDPGDDSDEQSQQSDRWDELAEYCPQLTFQQRLIGFGISFSTGCKYSQSCSVSLMRLGSL